MTAIDTSVAVAALAGWHAEHDAARRAAAGASIPAHARIETYSVLTRMPPPHRLASDIVVQLLGRWFPADRILVPPARLSRSIVERCGGANVVGGGIYDALVGLTASASGRTLVTRDERAAVTYRLLSIDFELTI